MPQGGAYTGLGILHTDDACKIWGDACAFHAMLRMQATGVGEKHFSASRSAKTRARQGRAGGGRKGRHREHIKGSR